MEDKKEIKKFVFGNQKRIFILSLILGLLFLYFGYLMKKEGEANAVFSMVIGAVFILAFLINFTFRKKIANRDIGFYEKNPNIFKLFPELTKAIDTYFSLRIIISIVIILIILMWAYF